MISENYCIQLGLLFQQNVPIVYYWYWHHITLVGVISFMPLGSSYDDGSAWAYGCRGGGWALAYGCRGGVWAWAYGCRDGVRWSNQYGPSGQHPHLVQTHLVPPTP